MEHHSEIGGDLNTLVVRKFHPPSEQDWANRLGNQAKETALMNRASVATSKPYRMSTGMTIRISPGSFSDAPERI